MLKSDLAVEYKVVGELKKAMAACELAQDYVCLLYTSRCV